MVASYEEEVFSLTSQPQLGAMTLFVNQKADAFG